jgi:hypothetical protein
MNDATLMIIFVGLFAFIVGFLIAVILYEKRDHDDIVEEFDQRLLELKIRDTVIEVLKDKGLTK